MTDENERIQGAVPEDWERALQPYLEGDDPDAEWLARSIDRLLDEIKRLREVERSARELLRCHDLWINFMVGNMDEAEIQGVGEDYARATGKLRLSIKQVEHEKD